MENTSIALICILDSIKIPRWTICPSLITSKIQSQDNDEGREAFAVHVLIKEDIQVFT